MLGIKYYNGSVMNRENSRPAIGSICFKVSKDWKINNSSKYELINIKVNNGQYDSYVIKNQKTGKISVSKCIAVKTTVTISKHTEPIKSDIKGIEGILDWSALRKQLELIAAGEIAGHERSASAMKKALAWYDKAITGDIAAAHALISYMVTLPGSFSGKMFGVMELGTSVKLNPLCKACQHIDNSVCTNCYANARMYAEQAAKLALCTYVLCTYKFTPEQVPVLWFADLLRFESFGDLLNCIQCYNYLTIARVNNIKLAGFWSKRPEIIYQTIMNDFDGIKPENVSVVYSSLFLNKIETGIIGKYILKNGSDMIDHIFTVFTADYAIKHDIEIHCLDSHCAIDCDGRCYHRETPLIVNEIVKKEQAKYKALKGIE